MMETLLFKWMRNDFTEANAMPPSPSHIAQRTQE